MLSHPTRRLGLTLGFASVAVTVITVVLALSGSWLNAVLIYAASALAFAVVFSYLVEKTRANPGMLDGHPVAPRAAPMADGG